MVRHQDLIAVGLTSRMVDHWVRAGYLKAHDTHPGNGLPRQFADEELPVAATMFRLVKAGLTVKAAHTVARGEAELAPGVQVLVDGEVTA